MFGHRCNIRMSCWLPAKGLDIPARRNSASGGSADSVPSGIGLVLRRFPQAIAVPVTLCHGMVQHDLPEISMQAGPPVLLDWRAMKSEEIAAQLGHVLEQQLDDHRATLIGCGQGSLPDAQPLIRGFAPPAKNLMQHESG